MVKKKLVEIVVCSALLLGDCIANGSDPEDQPAPEVQLEDPRQKLERLKEEIQSRPSEVTVEKLERQLELEREVLTQEGREVTEKDLQGQLSIMRRISAKRQGGATEDDLNKQQSLIRQIEDKLLEEQSRINDEDDPRSQSIEKRLKQLNEKQSRIGQALLLKQMLQIQQQLNAGSQGGGEASQANPFVSWEQLKGCLDSFRNGEMEVNILKSHIESTRRYYMSDQSIKKPSSVPDREWRVAKVVEMLHRIREYLPATRVASWCLESIYNNYPENNDESRKIYEYMKSLLLSQSVVWEDGKYALSARKDSALVKGAINQLCSIAKDPEGDDELIGAVRGFLRAINQQGYRNFFPPDYNLL
ncbi:MAG: hypothetical protein LBF34_03310 [Puniceicoccales bacterium]|jgi:hypothetical protein|nr:hypothetical protein [Puniceicoccales bacterium]